MSDPLDELPPGSGISARDWARIRSLHAAADELERAGEVMPARERSVQALRLAKSIVGNAPDPGLGACFFHLAEGVKRAGDLTGAEQNYNAAYGLLRSTEGEPTPLKVAVLQAYGELYMTMRLGWRAILMLDWARARAEELYGPQDANVGFALRCLAMSYEIAGVEDQAIAYYDQAIAVLGHAWGPTHPVVEYTTWARADLAFWRALKGDDRAGVEQALAAIRAGLRQLEHAAPREDLNVAGRRAQLGANLVAAGRNSEGATLLAEAITILEAAGARSGVRRVLAQAQIREGIGAQALVQVQRAMAEEPPLGHSLAHGSERERRAALGKAMWQLDQFLDVVLLANAGDDAAVVGQACDLVLSRKALGADLLVAQRRAASRNADPELKRLMAQLAELRARQADGSLEGGEFNAQIAVEIERVEWEITSRVPAMDAKALTAFTCDAAAGALPLASVLVEFVRFDREPLVHAQADAAAVGSRPWYVAFVIPAGAPQGVRLVDLGPAEELEASIRAYRAALARSEVRADAPVARAVGFKSRMHTQRNDGHDLRERLLGPLRPAIGDRTRVFIAPDGDLCWVPFEVLPAEDGGLLTDHWDISYLSTGRDLAGEPVAPKESLSGAVRRWFTRRAPAVVLADPDFDAKAARGAAQAQSGQPMAGAAELRDGLTRAGIHFQRLPGTRAEGVAVANLLRVEPLLGADASEANLKAIASPLVLHVATHGFFLPEPATASRAPTPSRGDLEGAAARNPLVRSGIALSGANTWLAGATPSDGGNGLVNGEDVVALDLTATELVVLSACQTGLGDVVPGEGVVGLRRAFKVAGARTLVLSLWSVPDEQTRMLMTAFYEGLLGGKGRSASLREAQQRVREQFPDPFYWAAFICIGDAGPIRRLDG